MQACEAKIYRTRPIRRDRRPRHLHRRHPRDRRPVLPSCDQHDQSARAEFMTTTGAKSLDDTHAATAVSFLVSFTGVHCSRPEAVDGH